MSDTDTPTVPASKHQVVANNLKLWFGVGTAGVGMLITFVTLTKQVKEEPAKPTPAQATQATPATSEITQVNSEKHQPSSASIQEPTDKVSPVPTTRPAPSTPTDEILVNNTPSIPKFPNTDTVDYLPSDGQGTGVSRDEALGKALSEAISKRTGMAVTAQVAQALSSNIQTSDSRQTTRISESIAQRFEAATAGLLKWWDLRSVRTKDGFYIVEVVAVVAKVHAAKTDGSGRRGIVVLPFRDEGCNASDFAGIGSQLRDKLVSNLTASRKFAVLDKSFQSETATLSTATPNPDLLQNLIDQAARLDAQYLVIGTLGKLSVSKMEISGLRVSQLAGLVNLRVIDIRTRQTLLGRSYNLASEPKLPTDPLILGDALADRMSTRILDTIYPIRVVSANTPGELVLDRGGEGLSPGDKLEVFNPGPELKDPATGETLGLSEQHAGLAEIIRVQPKVSVARLLNSTGTIRLGAVCRPPQALPTTNSNKPQDDIDKLFK